ncbi:MAG: methylmalonyl-CoA epimerase [bacterium]|nr:methylmalonyl-CoA epimerase [bacterium]
MEQREFAPPAGMAGRVDHLGIAVTDLEAGIRLYAGLLGLELVAVEEVPREKLKVALLKLDRDGGPGCVELLQPLDPDSNVGRFLEKKGPGLHHVAFAAQDMDAALAACRAAGLRLLNEEPLPGAHGKQVVFLHPKDTGGVLIEICSRLP